MIGRKEERNELESRYHSGRSEFIAIYGRRRVGKTYLVDEMFKNRITFKHTGLSPIQLNEQGRAKPLRQQLQAFYLSLIRQGMRRTKYPNDWLEAFFLLEMFLMEIDDGSRQIVFLDEMPWMDTAKSGFITALESFWNGWASSRDNMMLIVCGSAASWIQNELINNHGGLYNRVTCEIRLEPFHLAECEAFLTERGIHLSRYDIAQSYMLVGGIPFYLGYFEKGQSLPQVIDKLFFSSTGKLKHEYDRLFASIFTNPDYMKRIVETLGRRSKGFTRVELSALSGISNGSHLTNALKALKTNDFIESYVPFGEGKTHEHYKLVDPFCIFYLRFIKDKLELDPLFWSLNASSQAVSSWRGYAFENLCFNHIRQIKSALGVLMVSSRQSAWSCKADAGKETQIDMIIDRNDHIVNMCEMKFYGETFVVSKDYDLLLRQRQMLLAEKIPKKSVVHQTLVTTFGLKENSYSGIFDQVITLDDLFAF